MVQAAFVVVDEHAGSDVHRVYKTQALLDAALAQALVYLGRNVDKCAPARYVEPQLLAITLHRNLLLKHVVEVTCPDQQVAAQLY
jgi:hypothetical protein